jgi:HlyD family secretion protein
MEGVRRFTVPLAVLLVGGAAWLLLSPARREPAPSYVTSAIDRGPIRSTITATGTVNPVTTVQVGTYVSGPIQDILVDFNSPVRQGQLLARIDPRPFQVKVDAAAAALANARARVEKDEADGVLKAANLARTRQLADQGIVSTAELDVAVSEHRQARSQIALDEAEVRNAEAKLREAQVNLAYTDIASPVDGVVVSRNVDVGQTVAASFQTPTLFLVAEDLTKMQVSASVSESDIGGVAPGQEAQFTVDAYPGTAFTGRVSQVRNAPVTVQNVVTYDVIVNVDNTDLRLKPGMTANVTIVTAERDDALRVASSALRFRPPIPVAKDGAAGAAEPRDRGPRVWVLDDAGHPRPVPVETGISDDRFTEITGGLGAGERVIVSLVREPVAAPSGSAPFGGGRRH